MAPFGAYWPNDSENNRTTDVSLPTKQSKSDYGDLYEAMKDVLRLSTKAINGDMTTLQAIHEIRTVSRRALHGND